ncbi:nuclear factor Y, subunit C13 [Tasmannia lanceolata]|uniref:nuclear factor Y, subunit C13 n=1 Tax=Tasmannia lanceolata TaxID=3420 RepID=UPI004064B464
MEEDDKVESILSSEFPLGRVKKIVKADNEIKKVNSEAILLISLSTQLFLRFLSQESLQIVLQKKKKTIKLDHLRVAAKTHLPTNDFLIDSLSLPSQPSIPPSKPKIKSNLQTQKIPTRRIDDFFCKSAEDSAL